MKNLLLTLLFVTSSVFAIPEAQFRSIYYSEVIPFFKAQTTSSFSNYQGKKVFYSHFQKEGNQKVLVVFPGRSEPRLKYAELMWDLKNAGFDIFVIDHQGQGDSDRALKDTHKGYVRKFHDYEADVDQWMNEVVYKAAGDRPVYLLAHSMGGTIAARYLAYYPHRIKKVLLSAPMMQVNTAPYSETTARLLARALVISGKATQYAPDRGPYVADEDTFEVNEVTSSPERFEATKFLFVQYPELTIGGPTTRWVLESLLSTKAIDQLATKIKIPVLLYQSGKDQIVFSGRQDKFCLKGADCTKVTFPDAQHEILQEKDVIRDEAMAKMLEFFQ
jgi:lysophospholipase